jgi:glutathione synthase/RimK-type ligase-like ATP-grasp enzyme
LVFFGGRFSHAVRKAAVLGRDTGVQDALWKQEVIVPQTPSEAQLEIATAALAAAAAHVGDTTYARVDVIDGDDGTPVVLEVELVEPSLFLSASPKSPKRFAHLIAAIAAA